MSKKKAATTELDRGERVFLMAAAAADVATFVRSLESWAWLDLHSYLLQNYNENSFSGQVLGLMFVVGAERYARELRPESRIKNQESRGEGRGA